MFWKLQENAISARELDLLVSFIQQTSRFTQFTKVKEYEQAFSQWQGCKYSVYVNSGSSANLLLINAMKEKYNWQTGDEIIVPAVTWPTTITPVMQCELKPVFVDINLQDLSFDYKKLKTRITDRTRGIFVAHLLGFPANIQLIKEITSGLPIRIMEDCCESQGASQDGVKVGNLSEAGTFSFYWGHHMTTVEGGMICTNDEDLYKRCILKRSHGLARELPEEFHFKIKAEYPDIDFNFLFLTDGFNFRNTEFNAVLGLSQIERIDNFIEIRNRNYKRFVSICKKYENELIILEKEGCSSFTIPFFFKSKESRLRFQEVIREAGIESRPLISGNLLRQPFLRQYYIPEEFPNADFIHENCFYIGNNQFVDDKNLDCLENLIEKFKF